MEDPPSMTLVHAQKRSHDDLDTLPPVSTPKKSPPSSNASSPLSVLSTVPSPSSVKMVVGITAPTQASAASATTQQPAKRRKLTQQEKDDQKREKEAKEKAKADQKAEREEQKRLKDEEKRKKNEEREEKKRAKDFEQQQKEEDKKKKERSQMKLNSFFAKPKPVTDSSANPAVDTAQPTPSQPIFLEPVATDLTDANSTPASPQKSKSKSDYERVFLPYQPPSHSIIAPYNALWADPVKRAAAKSRLDNLASRANVSTGPVSLESFKSLVGPPRPRGLNIIPLRKIIECLEGTSNDPIDLTKGDASKELAEPLEILKRIPMKYLHFHKDVRPPYYGTYTVPYSDKESAKLARNPFSQTRQDTDYDYDSEAEWQEPEEGDEDLDTEGEDDLSDDGDDDMEGFLDDEDEAQVKRRLISSDLVPVSTGLCWEDDKGVSTANDGSGAISTEFKDFRMGFLLQSESMSIDPFSTAYWAPDPALVAKSSTTTSKEGSANGLMQPPRIPLTQRPINGLLNPKNGGSTVTASKPAKPQKRMVPAEQLSAFKSEIAGSDLTKIALVEALKKKFPKMPKDVINNTLSTVAARVGVKEVDKRWVLLP
ncbi:chromatin assembly factor 1 subunit A-domain-containing protein [Dendryphion nanum]|uniref:Chromatin assembly factor 1 subunit A-domain-containing protein n=1 Tax=Dendryphion nanum TaxID=256645 RepID=A0A9P9ECJ5_9PLEO|nr:chromatin assembly factor 1 subunit A-domain-containing protein [Dendryphion nanum]